MPVLARKVDVPFELYEINLLGAYSSTLMQINKEYGLAMTPEGMLHMQSHFTRIGRNPFDVEIKTWADLGSEHCYHISYKALTTVMGNSMDTYLRKADIKGREIDNLINTCVIRANKKINAPWFLHTGNSGIVDAGDGEYAYSLRVETHNHPSQVEPYGGAATGVGGILRDIIADRGIVIGVGDNLFFGTLDFPYSKLPAGTKHPSYIQDGVVHGIEAYGNNMGIPNISGSVYYDESYTGNVLVFCSAFGCMPKSRVGRVTIAPDDAVILAGGRTGADGIGGVTFASEELHEKSDVISRSAVQVPEPIEEEKIRRALYEIFDRELDTSGNDVGGGGLVCPACETPHKYGLGTELWLDYVPLRQTNLPPWIIAISESQERMYLTTRQKNVPEVLQIFEDEDVEANVVGKIINEPYARMYYKSFKVADIDLNAMLDPPQARRVAVWKPRYFPEPQITVNTDLTNDLLRVLSSPNVASRESITRTVRVYDSEVQGNTVTKHLQGVWRKEGPADAIVIKPTKNWNGMVVSVGTHPRYCKINGYHGFMACHDEAIRNNVATGGRRWASSINTAGGNPEKEDRWGYMLMMSLGAYVSALIFGVSYVTGKDSLYNESPFGPINPTAVITTLGIIPDVRKAVTMDAKEPGNNIYLLGLTYPELGGSEYFWIKDRGALGNDVPKVNGDARKTMDAVIDAIDRGYVRACHDLSDGGLGTALAEMAFAGDIGVDADLRRVPRTRSVKRNYQALFSQSNTRLLVEVRDNDSYKFEDVMKRRGVRHAQIGKTRNDKGFTIYGLDGRETVQTDIDRLRYEWRIPMWSHGHK